MDIIETILIGVTSVVLVGTSNAHTLSATDLLDKYAQNQDKLNSSVIVKFECEQKLVQDNEIVFDRVAPAEVRLSEQKYLACTNYHYDKLSVTALPLDETEYRQFTLWDGERRIKYYDDVEWPRAWISRQNEPGAVFASAWPGSPLFGICYHKAERIDIVLRQCETLSVRDKMETISSEACYVIDAKSPTSTYTIWMNPKRGYNISQAIIKLSPGAQGAFDILSVNEDRSLTVSDMRFQQIGEVHVPMVYNAYFEYRRDGVVYRKGTEHGKVTDITFDPDHEKFASFIPKMRNGTIITDKDFDLTFRWYGGRLVPNVDEAVIEQIDKMTEEILAEGQVSKDLETTQKTKIATNEPTIVKEAQPERQVDTAKGRGEVLSETRPYMLLLIPIGLLIIGIIYWKVYIIKGRKN